MRRLAWLIPLVTPLLTLLAACSSKQQELFVVLPNPGGGSGAVTVNGGGKSVLLDQPYSADEERGGKFSATSSNQDQVQQVFGSALSAQPILPKHFRLYFISDSDQLTPESQKEYAGVFEDIKQRPVYQVEVIGHTDTFASAEYNQKLSMERAVSIKQRLVHDGLDPKSISVAGRGKRDLLVKTPDGVHEQRNRRVEITVR